MCITRTYKLHFPLDSIPNPPLRFHSMLIRSPTFACLSSRQGLRFGGDCLSSANSLSTSRTSIRVAPMSVRSVKISNVSLSASVQDIKEFFSFSGDIEHVELQSADEWSQIAYVTFRDSQGAETALLLSGATIVDLSVIVTPAPEYQVPIVVSAPEHNEAKATSGSGSVVQKAEDVVTTMLAKGFILGKDAVNKAKTFDEKHSLTSTASSRVASFDKKIGLTEKISMGTSAVNERVKVVDEKLKVSETTKSAFTAAEQTISNAGSAIMKNRYVFTGASWVTGAFSKVAKAASDVGAKTKEKVAAEQHQRG